MNDASRGPLLHQKPQLLLMRFHGRGFVNTRRADEMEFFIEDKRFSDLPDALIGARFNRIDSPRDAQPQRLADVRVREPIKVLCLSCVTEVRMSIEGIRAANNL
jgi:hypothetical protein